MSTVIGQTGISTPVIGFGAMSLSVPVNVSEEEALAILKEVLSQADEGTKVIINTSEQYGFPSNFTHNLQLLSSFFSKYPEYKEKAFVIVKGALGVFPAAGQKGRSCSAESLRLSAEGIAKTLHPKQVDVFEPGRMDPKVPVEEVMTTLVQLQKEGLFLYIGLSECSAATVKRAVAIAPVTTVEIDVSPMSWEEETKKVIELCDKIKATILAYGPMGRGALTGTPYEDIHALIRAHCPRFQKDAFEKNQKFTSKLESIAQEKGISVAQLSIAWVRAQGNHIVPIPGTSKLYRIKENFAAGQVVLSEEDIKKITALTEAAEIHGDRFPVAVQHLNWG